MLMSTPFPPEEGIGYYVYNLSKKLVSNGHEVTVVTRGMKKILIDDVQGIKVVKLPFLGLYPFHIQLHGRHVNRYLKEHENEFDLIHVHTPLSPVPKTRLPIVSTVHTSVIGDSKHINVVDSKSLSIKIFSPTMGKYLVSKLIKKSCMVMTVSAAIAEELEVFYNLSNAIVVGNGFNRDEFSNHFTTKRRNYLLYVGRLSYRKGVSDLIKAIQSLQKENKIELIICGKGEIKDELNNYINNNNLNKYISLKGHVERDELVSLYYGAQAFVLPSHYEGLPTTLLEAMAAGCPVIVSDIPAIRGLIEDGVSGLIFPKGSVRHLSEKILTIINDDSLANRLGIEGQRRVFSDYTWDDISNRILECYNIIIGGMSD